MLVQNTHGQTDTTGESGTKCSEAIGLPASHDRYKKKAQGFDTSEETKNNDAPCSEIYKPKTARLAPLVVFPRSRPPFPSASRYKLAASLAK